MTESFNEEEMNEEFWQDIASWAQFNAGSEDPDFDLFHGEPKNLEEAIKAEEIVREDVVTDPKSGKRYILKMQIVLHPLDE